MTIPYRPDNPFAPKQYRPDNPFAPGRERGPTPEDTAQEQIRNYKGIGRAMVQGLTFGFGDEIEAGLRSAVGPETYRETLDQIRADQAAFRSKHPVLNIGSELAGGSVVALPGVGTSIAKAPTVLKKGLALAKTGAIYGAVAGAGTSESGVTNRLKGAVRGAGIGAVATPVLAGAGTALVGGGKMAAHALGITTEAGRKEHALQQLAKVFADAGLTPDEVAAQVAERRAAGDADLVLGQFLGASGRQALKASTTMPSEAKNAAFEALSRIKQGAAGRLVRSTEQATGIQRQNLEDLAATLIQQQKAKAAPLYQAVDQIGPMDLVSDEADAALGYLTRKMPGLTDDVMRYIAEEGIPLESVVDDAGRLSPKYYDILKKAIDARLFGKSRGSADDLAWVKMNRRQVLRARDELLKGVDESVRRVTGADTYKIARDTWAGDEEGKRALALGRKAFGKTPDQIRAELAVLSPGEVELYRTAALDSYRTKLLNRTTSPVPLLQKNQTVREKLRAVFGEAMDQVEQQIASEGQKLDFANALHGSDTVERLTGIADQQVGIDELANIVQGKIGPSVMGTLRRGATAGFRKTARDRAAETARALTAGADRPGDLDTQLEALKAFLTRPPGKAVASTSSPGSGGGRGLLARLGVSSNQGQSGPGGTSMMSSMAGGLGGGAYGATQGDTPRERFQNALLYGAAGAAGGYLLGRGAERFGANGARPSIPSILGHEAGAIGKQPSKQDYLVQRNLEQFRRQLRGPKPERTLEESLAKYAKMDDAALIRRAAELQDRVIRVQQSPEYQHGIKQWSVPAQEANNYNSELGGYVPVQRTAVSNAAGRAIGAMKRDDRLIAEIVRVLKHRGLTEDEAYWRIMEAMDGRPIGSTRPPEELPPLEPVEAPHSFAPGLLDEGSDVPDVRLDPDVPLPEPPPDVALPPLPADRHAAKVGLTLRQMLEQIRSGAAPLSRGRASKR